jgi:gliding motility-associated-like protein
MKKLLQFFLAILPILSQAQPHEPISVTGFNHDVVADGSGSSSFATTTKEMDALGISNYVFCTKEFADANGFTPSGIYGLPTNGLLSSPDRSYQFSPFNGNNALYLLTDESGSLSLTNPALYTNLSLLVLATEGSATISVTFNFSDGSVQQSTKNVPDWFNQSTSPFNGYGRVKRIDGPFLSGVHYEGAENGRPIFTTLDFELPCEKTLQSISIFNSSPGVPAGSSFRAFVFAASGTKITTSPQVSIVASKTTICQGDSIQFTATGQDGGTVPTYVWRINGIPVPISNNPVLKRANLANGDVVTCSMTSNASCAFPATVISNSISITANPILIPSISITSSETKVCEGTSVQYQAQSTNGGTPKYSWFLNGVRQTTMGNAFTLTDPSDGDLVMAELVSNATCVAFDTATSNELSITVIPVFNLQLTPVDSQNVEGNPVQLTASPTGGVWSGPGIVGNEFDPKSVGPGLYNLVYSFPENECTNPDSISIRVFEEKLPCELEPAELITVNGDSKNDQWIVGIFNKICIQKAEVEVYDRWGKSVFKSDTYDNQWEANNVNPGTYFFRVVYQLHDKPETVKKSGILLVAK